MRWEGPGDEASLNYESVIDTFASMGFRLT